MLSLVLFLAAAPIVDVERHSVTFDVVSPDCGMNSDIEFLFAGPDSDRDYESMFLTENSISELADAFAKAGFPLGAPSDYRVCRFWPTGDEIVFEPDIWSFIRDMRDERKAAVLFTGGARDADGVPLATKDMPQALFALYDCPQSLFQFDDALGQSDTYGRFRPKIHIPRGEKRTITATWKGASLHEKLTLALAPSSLADVMATLRQKCEAGIELDVTTVFSPEMTIEEAKGVAEMLRMLESYKVKLNGFAPGQFYYRAFLPLERWRDRTERLTQPYEVRLDAAANPSLTVIKEDWTTNADSTDPTLIVTENVDFASLGKGDAPVSDTCLIFAPKSTKLSDVFKVRGLLPPSVTNFYVYGD